MSQPPSADGKSRTVSLVNLGCPKNQVDAEVMLGQLEAAGYTIVERPDQAELIVVNTCAFIQEARAESVQAILEAAELKRTGGCRAVVVSGCLPQRYGGQLPTLLPEVDAFVGTGEFPRIADIARATLRRRRADPRWITGHTALVTAALPRHRLSPAHYAYLKIAEGCDRTCTFCAIPGIRGRLRSRTPADIVAEARSLAAAGVRELVLVSQETTSYGADRGDPHALVRLLEGLLQVAGLRWIRLHYLYPTRLGPELLRLLAGEPRLCRYLDLPLQHVDGAILRAMGRGGNEHSLRRLLDRVRDRVPDVTIRTSFITGFPGETARQFARLLAFVEAVRFDRVGVFRYSDEEGTAAAALRPKVPRRTAEARRARLMAAQARIAEAKGRAWLGSLQEVVVDGPSPDFPDVQCGRTARHAPEVDGTVYLRGPKAAPGTLVRARILEAFEHDLTAEIVETVEEPWPAAHR